MRLLHPVIILKATCAGIGWLQDCGLINVESQSCYRSYTIQPRSQDFQKGGYMDIESVRLHT